METSVHTTPTPGLSQPSTPPVAAGEAGSVADYHRFERVYVRTDFPIASHSPDYVHPHGTKQNNSRHLRFNTKLHQLFDTTQRPLTLLDLGCAGGGFVKSCLDDGCIAVGIEGSDYSMRTARAEWGALGGRFLFTADITRPFEIRICSLGGESTLLCDVVTAWEVLEHVAEPDLEGVCRNICRHLSAGGIAVMSISTVEYVYDGVALHQTVRPKEWWVTTFARHGLHHQPHLEQFFGRQYVRGRGPEADTSSHLVLSRDPPRAPVPPKRSVKARLADRWFASTAYRLTRRVLGIE
jgi:2-polyprenyl-3-methyl-5-hydroxy-6-metoxy-1,4-benzoquinol methylase